MTKKDYENDIDLVNLLKTLWMGKWLVSAFVIAALLLGLIYLQFNKGKYEISASYILKNYPSSFMDVCDKEISCIENKILNPAILNTMGNEWVVKKNKFILNTKNLLDLSEYQADFESFTLLLNAEVYKEALGELSLLETKKATDGLFATETFAELILRAKRNIRKIDSGERVITFGPIYIERQAPTELHILLLSIVLGGFIGCGYVLLQDYIKNERRNSLSEG